MSLTPSFQLAGITLAAGIALGGASGWRITSWANQAHELAAVKAARIAERSDMQKIIDDLQGQVKTQQEASLVYQNELALLRAQPVATGPVRLCVRPPSPKMPAASATQPGSDGATPTTRPLQPEGGGNLEAGPDIGPDLRALFREADALLAKCRGLQRAAPK